MALGPLTNLALAVRVDPSIPQKLKDLYIMGGNMEGGSGTGLQSLRNEQDGLSEQFLSLQGRET